MVGQNAASSAYLGSLSKAVLQLLHGKQRANSIGLHLAPAAAAYNISCRNQRWGGTLLDRLNENVGNVLQSPAHQYHNFRGQGVQRDLQFNPKAKLQEIPCPSVQ